MKKFVYLVYMLSFTISVVGQKVVFNSPVEYPIILNGNFGELRPNHFHAGIDIKTNGETGVPVFSVDDGFVSRIVVSGIGYGNVLYIDHPNGYTSVYAHLSQFAKPILEWFKKQQYEQKAFEIDIKPDQELFKIKRGEKIALSGNTGSSAGPHLHFEIRNTETEFAINPLQFDFNINDTKKPVASKLFIYPLSNESQIDNKTIKQRYDLAAFGNVYHPKTTNPVLNVYGDIGFGFDAIDYFDGNWSKCGIYQMELWIDDKMINSFEIDEIDMNNQRYFNSHIDYDEFVRSGEKIHKCFVDPGNKMSIYKQTVNGGVFNFSDGQKHSVKIQLFDISMNTQSIEFEVQSTTPILHQKDDGVKHFSYSDENKFENDNVEVIVPKGNLYTDINFDYKESSSVGLGYSPVYSIHTPYTPIHKGITVKIKATQLPEKLQDKAIIGLIEPKSKKIISLGGQYSNGWVKTESKYFGDMIIVADTTKPTIRSLSIKDNTLLEPDRLRFKIDDDLSGIASFDGFIDSTWVLFQYDAKNDLLNYVFDENITKGQHHKIELLVKDKKGNYKIFEGKFTY